MGTFIRFVGRAIQIPCVLIGSLLCLGIVFEKLGVILGIIAIFLFPVVGVILPFYAGFADGDWLPLILVYGGSFGGGAIVALGAAIDGEV